MSHRYRGAVDANRRLAWGAQYPLVAEANKTFGPSAGADPLRYFSSNTGYVPRRFVTYGTILPEFARRYVDTIETLPAMQEWLTAARVEHDFVAEDEPYRQPNTATSDIDEPTQQ